MEGEEMRGGVGGDGIRGDERRGWGGDKRREAHITQFVSDTSEKCILDSQGFEPGVLMF